MTVIDDTVLGFCIPYPSIRNYYCSHKLNLLNNLFRDYSTVNNEILFLLMLLINVINKMQWSDMNV